MHHDVMVEPAQGREVVRVVVAAGRSWADVMRLEAGRRGAAVGDASVVAGEHPTAGALGDRGPCITHREWSAVLGSGGHLDRRLAQDPFQCVGTDARTGGEPGAGFAVRRSSRRGIDDHGRRDRPPVRISVGGSEAEIGEPVESACRPRFTMGG